MQNVLSIQARIIFACILTFTAVGCGGGNSVACSTVLGALAGGSNACNNSDNANNSNATTAPEAGSLGSVPIANPGSSQNTFVGSLVTLDGSKSTDPNNNLLTFQWVFTAKPPGSTASFYSSTATNPFFTADLSGTYVATLVVNNGKLDSIPAQVRVVASIGNAAPVAYAGADQNVLVGSMVKLDGTKSTDANYDLLTFNWNIKSKPDGSNALLSSNTDGQPSFKTDVLGTYVVSLVVSDGKANSDTSLMKVTALASSQPPVALPGAAQNVTAGTWVSLDGSNSKTFNIDLLSYAWTLTSKPTWSSASISPPGDPKPKIFVDIPGQYVASLIVTSVGISSSPATVLISALTANLKPVADAGAAQNVSVGRTVTLNGSKSNDPNGDQLTFRWVLFAKPDGSNAILSSNSSVKPSFIADLAGTYAVSLIVNDGKVDSTLATTVVTAAVGNSAPIAFPGANVTVLNGVALTLDGTGSTDANNDPLTYKWTLISKPANSAAILSSLTAEKPTFRPDVPGTYVVNLTVNDGFIDSSTVSLAIVSNAAPVAIAGVDQTVKLGALVKLDGNKSTDLNNDTLTYKWRLLSKPLNSSVALSSLTDSMPSFTPDKTGDYSITLTVNDGFVDSTTVAVKITVTMN